MALDINRLETNGLEVDSQRARPQGGDGMQPLRAEAYDIAAGRVETARSRWLQRSVKAMLVGGVGLLLVGLLAWELPLGGQLHLQVGDVSSIDIVAPRQITYESAVLTQEARARAEQAVPDYYDSPEGRVRRQQVNRAREILQFISTVRADPYATVETKIQYIAAIPDLNLTAELIQRILALSADDWNDVENEVPLALDRTMREEIRENNLSTVRRRVPLVISADLGEETSSLTAEVVKGLIRPNSFFNAERTLSERQDAINAIPLQTNTLERGEIILRAGDIAKPEDMEALQQLGLQQTEWDWWHLVRALLFGLPLMVAVGSALYRLYPQIAARAQVLALPALLAAIWLVAAKFMIVPHNVLPYLYPLAALSMLLTALMDLRVAVVSTMAFVMVLTYFESSNVALTAFMGLGSLIGAVVLGRAERLTAFVWAGVAVTLTNLLLMFAFPVPFGDLTSGQILQALLLIALNGGLSASIALIGYFVLGNLFGITTSLQLMELSRPTHPLLRQLLLKAPGTYHHTILVSNLAERAAEAIGADAFLTRVGAYYHDIGKTVRPYFFVENIDDGKSPHDKLDPLTSAQIIISHVKDGVDLAQKYRLPARLQDFIREHHGAQVMSYFYQQARKEIGEGESLRVEDFAYPGPDPRTKETAILLLADTCEAAVRAERPGSREALEELVSKLVTARVVDGTLESSNLTFHELQIVRQTFVHILQGVHHPRIKYPDAQSAPAMANAPHGGPSALFGSGDATPLPADGRGKPAAPAAEVGGGSKSLIYSFSARVKGSD